MEKYITNKNTQSNGDHEIHNATTGCNYMPNIANQINLGFHTTCHGAVSEARGQASPPFYEARNQPHFSDQKSTDREHKKPDNKIAADFHGLNRSARICSFLFWNG